MQSITEKLETVNGIGVTYVAPESGAETDSAIDSLIHDLSDLRNKGLSQDPRRRSAIVAGQVLLLAQEYRAGKRLNRKTLKHFFYLVAREAA